MITSIILNSYPLFISLTQKKYQLLFFIVKIGGYKLGVLGNKFLSIRLKAHYILFFKCKLMTLVMDGSVNLVAIN